MTEPTGIDNIGATCWLNALVQCFRVCPGGQELEHKTRNLLLNKFGNVPSDAQEALVYIIDELKLNEFVGEETQTVVFPDGKSVRKSECTVWFHENKSDVISDYVDDNGKKHNIAIVQRELTKVPKILVSDYVSQTHEYHGKELRGIVCWGWGHYIAYVKSKGEPLDKDGSLDNWYYANDTQIRKVDSIPSSARIAFYC